MAIKDVETNESVRRSIEYMLHKYYSIDVDEVHGLGQNQITDKLNEYVIYTSQGKFWGEMTVCPDKVESFYLLDPDDNREEEERCECCHGI